MKRNIRRINIWLLSIASIAFCLPLLTSCSEWLDVQPETQVREDAMFEKYKGFQDALSGCYLSMANRSIYGQYLTMDMIEMMGNLWATPTETSNPAYYYLFQHEYGRSESSTVIQSIYGGLYNVIVQANNIIVNLEKSGDAISSEQAKKVIEGEAYAIRAYCQLDILRLFGQMPQNAQKTVSLPYAEMPSIDELPSYYGYSDYVKKLETDLNYADQLLSQYDPAVSYGFNSSADLNDDYLTYRRHRMNVWAVKALKARFYQYIGDASNANRYAKEVINATVNGSAVVSLAKQDLDGIAVRSSNILDYFYALPDECLFALSNSELLNYSVKIVGGKSGTGIVTTNTNTMASDNTSSCYLTTDQLNQLFSGRNLSANNRYVKVWEKQSQDRFGTIYPTIRKYYYDSSLNFGVGILRTMLQIMPLIRLSEMYLIAMETTTSLSEGNELYKTYMASHEENITSDFETLEALRSEVLNEYRREFYGEGVMFYTYKRLGTVNPLWAPSNMSENEYILPLPSTEYVTK